MRTVVTVQDTLHTKGAAIVPTEVSDTGKARRIREPVPIYAQGFTTCEANSLDDAVTSSYMQDFPGTGSAFPRGTPPHVCPGAAALTISNIGATRLLLRPWNRA